MIGGLSLFLFGMNIMGEALERAAGNSLRSLLGKLTTSRMLGFLTGLAVTAVIQSSSANTVMVVGFVNSGLLTLGQAINVIMGANVGTTATAWILSLSGIEGDNLFVQLLKPTSFTPVLALLGIVYYMFIKDGKKKDIDDLKEQMRTRHILRLQQGICSIETGFIWSDLLNSLERTSDHCSNIAGCILDLHNHNMNTHEAIRSAKLDGDSFGRLYTAYAEKYQLA